MRRRVAVVLAAGKGTRMRSERPKVLHRAAGRPLLDWVLDAARRAGCEELMVVVGHGADEVRETVGEGRASEGRAGEGPPITWVLQEEQNGTGHALAQAAPHFTGAGGDDALLLVLSGDVPLVTAGTLDRLAEAAEAGWGAMATATLDEPGSLGRVLARPRSAPADDHPGGDRLERIVEARDADAEVLAVRRINAGIYALPAPAIFEHLARLDSDNAQGELYLTDAVGAAADAEPGGVTLVELPDPTEALGVNTQADLARVHRALVDRHLDRLMDSGVTVLEPARTTVEATVRVSQDTVIHPGVCLSGHTEVGPGCELHQGAWLSDCTLGEGVIVEPYCVLDGARVEAGCRIGPFARLRPASILRQGAKVGTFVEIKNSQLGAGAKAPHLSYVGDAEVGAGANIGAGVVTCNYDGRDKHRTEIGEGAFVGSDTMLVAPVKIGDGAYTAAGSVITKDVEPGALAVERSQQRNVAGWAKRRKRGK